MANYNDWVSDVSLREGWLVNWPIIKRVTGLGGSCIQLIHDMSAHSLIVVKEITHTHQSSMFRPLRCIKLTCRHGGGVAGAHHGSKLLVLLHAPLVVPPGIQFKLLAPHLLLPLLGDTKLTVDTEATDTKFCFTFTLYYSFSSKESTKLPKFSTKYGSQIILSYWEG